MKIKIIMFVFTCTIATVYCSPKEEIIQPKELENIIEKHPLVKKAKIYEVYYDSLWKAIYYKSKGEEPKSSYTFDLDLTLTNGHTVTFREIPNSLSFHRYGRLKHINDIYFSCSCVDHKKKSVLGSIYLKDICKATNTNYYDLYLILDNYNDFCRLLNSLPFRLDKNAEKLCAKYSANNYVVLYRGSGSTSEKNKFIEIPEECK